MSRQADASVRAVLSIDPEFQSLIPALLPEEFAQLEANILRDGCKDPLIYWLEAPGKHVLVDGHNRYAICTKHGEKFKTEWIEVPDRDAAKLWICEHQLGRRNLTDGQRDAIAVDVMEWRSALAMKEQRQKAAQAPRKPSESEKSSPPLPDRTAKTIVKVAKEVKSTEWRLRSAQETKNKAPELHARVIAGRLTPSEARKLSALPSEARTSALAAVDSGVTAAGVIREAKKKEARKVVSIFVELSNKLTLLAPSYSDGEEHVFVRLLEDVCRAPKHDLSPTDKAHLQSIKYLLDRIQKEFAAYSERLAKP